MFVSLRLEVLVAAEWVMAVVNTGPRFGSQP